MPKKNVPTQRRYPPELRERAVRMVKETIAENSGDRHGVITWVAIQLGIGSESLRAWVRQAEIDGGLRAGLQIAKRLPIDFPDDESMRVSHEAIYQALYVQGRGAEGRHNSIRVQAARA